MNWIIDLKMGTYLFVVLAFFEARSFAQDAHVRLDLRQKSIVTGARIYLSDIAKCSGDRQKCQEATGIDVGVSPVAGRASYVSRSTLESILEKEWPGLFVDITGPDSIRVEAVGVELVADDIAAKLQEEISTRMKPIASEIRIHVVRVQSMGFTNVRPTQIKIEFPDLGSIPFDQVDWLSKNLPGTRTVQVRIVNPQDADDKSVIQAMVSFNVERHLPVLRQIVSAGSVVASSNVVMAWAPMRRGFQDFAIDANSISGKKSRQSIAAGEPVPSRFLDSPMAVLRNQQVTMLVRRGDLEISSRATTVDSGAIGQTVEVVNFATKKRLRARVIDGQTVEALAL